MDFAQKIAELQEAIKKFMAIHNNPHDTTKHNPLAELLDKQLAPVLDNIPSPTTATATATVSEITGSVGKNGDNNKADVITVQQLLDIDDDGICGKGTIGAIETFQRSIGFSKPDGRIDAGGTTWKKLKGNASSSPVEDNTPDPVHDNNDSPIDNTPVATVSEITGSVGKKGDNNKTDVITVQRLLGIDDDGICGKGTIGAIETFQRSIGFSKPDGRIDAGGTTWKKLKGNATPVKDNTPDPIDNTPDPVVDDTTTPTEDTTTPVDNTPPSDLQGNSEIKKSVGKGGDNDPADVVTVQKLLKETWGYDIPQTGVVEGETIQAIAKFQYRFVGNIKSQDSKIDAGGKTWKYLVGTLKPTMGKTDDGIIGGAETEEEKKMAEFTKAFTGIQIEVNPSEFVSVRPPYHINLGKRLKRVLKARKANSKVKKIISKLGYGGSVGKATPAQIEKFLEDCIAQNLIKDKSAQGLHEFLSTYGVSTDCSGLAIQAANFLVQGDMERSTSGQKDEDVKITNTAGIQRHPKVSSPTKLKAGDMMVNYKRKGTGTYHVRIIIDVDVEGDAIAFTTVESGSASDLGDGGDGVGQRRWKFPDGTKFENVHILKGNDWSKGGKSDQAYTYVRMKQLGAVD